MYISIEDIQKYKEEVRNCFAPLHREVINAFVYGLTQLPPTEVEPVRYGKWIEHIEKPDWLEDDVEVYYTCSCCETNNFCESPYCPNCGAHLIKED